MNIIRKAAAAAFAFALAALLCSCEHADSESLSTVSTENFAEQGDLSTEKSLSTAEQSDLSTEANEAEFIYAHIGDSVLKILPEQNSSAKAFAELLQTGDLTVEMEDYGGFEKVGSIGTKLPTNDERITAVPGDVILYQGSSVTIYYGVNTWEFTRIGRVQDFSPEELKTVLGEGSATVTFSVSK